MADFGSIFYLIIFIINLFFLSFYSVLIIFNPKKLITDYEFGDDTMQAVRLIGSFIIPLVLIGIYLLFTSVEGAWIYFVLGTMISIYQLGYDFGTRMKIFDSSYKIINQTQDTIIGIAFVAINLTLLFGMQDIIFA